MQLPKKTISEHIIRNPAQITLSIVAMAQQIWSKHEWKIFKSQNTRTWAVKQFFLQKTVEKKYLNNNSINENVIVEEKNIYGVPPLDKELWVANDNW